MSMAKGRRSGSRTAISWQLPGARVAALMGTAFILQRALHEFYNIAWGTGTWYREFSVRWGTAYGAFFVLCAALLVVVGMALWGRLPVGRIREARERLGPWRWLLFTGAVLIPIWLLQYSPWGVVFAGPFLRLLLWGSCVAVLAVLLLKDNAHVWTHGALLTAIVLSGSAIIVAAAFTNVTDHPFSLGWSEGNRLWDYSLLFGKRLYRIEPGREPVAYLDLGRQLIGGLPYLLPHVSILGARLWLAIVSFLPYMALGLIAFWRRGQSVSPSWILAGMYGFMLLSQGPIHVPLIVCALLVALAWRLPLWWAAAFVAASGFFAETSRFTWMFAPGMWAVMLEIGSASLFKGKVPRSAWHRAIVLGSAGLAGAGLAYAGILDLAQSSIGSSAAVSTGQELLWYRLLPNATFGEGILLGLLKATGPLLVVLANAGLSRWRPSGLQVIVPALILAACLGVGLIVSTKIGGGGDLHNLDMFLIGLLFMSAILWRAVGNEWSKELVDASPWLKALTVLLVALPALGPLRSLRPISFAADAPWLSVLADVQRPRDLGSLPDSATVAESLGQIRQAVADAEGSGPVLFMDQRQLLTFGYLRDITLIPEYEKKRLMDEALSKNSSYFLNFYRDLASKRFTLLVSSALRTPIRDSDYGFGEENNSWVTWVAKPVLCYYEELDTLVDVKVELLVPKPGPVDCSAVLPVATP